jgi:hypothetical protein
MFGVWAHDPSKSWELPFWPNQFMQSILLQLAVLVFMGKVIVELRRKFVGSISE